MKDFKLKLRGFIGIKKGLGLDEIELNLQGLTGLVALAGPNGRGKTTILDNLHPYPCLGSRDGTLAKHVFLRDAYRDIEFYHDQHHYRCLIKIDAESGASEGYLWIDGEPQVKGKISEYKAKIADIFGSQILFFESVFCAQNAEPLSDKRTGDLRNLFAEFLRLDRLQTWHETAKSKKNQLVMQSEIIDQELIRLQGQMDIRTQLDLDIENNTTALDTITTLINDNRDALDVAKASQIEIATALQQQEIIKMQAKTLRDTYQQIVIAHEQTKKEREQTLTDMRSKALTLQADIKSLNATLTDKDKIIVAGDTLKQIQTQLEIMRTTLQDYNQNQEKYTKEINDCNMTVTTIRNLIASIQSNPDIRTLQQEISQLKMAMKDLERKESTCISITCPFIATAERAKARLPLAEKELAEKIIAQKEMEEIKQLELKEVTARLDVLNPMYAAAQANIKKLNAEISLLSSQIKINSDLAARLPQIAAADAQLESKECQLDEILKQGTAAKDELDLLVRNHLAETYKLTTEIATAEAGINKDITPESLKLIELKQTGISKTIETLITDRAAASSKIESAKIQLAGLEKVKADYNTQQALKSSLGCEIAEWAYIQTGLGKDRLQALEIAGAAPAITAYANRLLASAFGPGVQVMLKTQNDEGKEILDIVVIDEDGEEVPLAHRSGGQQVWALKALRLAMAMLSKEKSGRNFKSILTDEEDGALDTEKATAFIHLYRAFMAEGGFETCFYISHKAECVAMADHQIAFGAAGVEVI